MINLTQSRANCYSDKFKCYWIRREESKKNDNETLSWKNKGKLFYAAEITPIERSKDEFENAISVPFQELSITTFDDIRGIKQDDKVRYQNDLWIVTSVSETRLPSFSMYVENKRFVIRIRK